MDIEHQLSKPRPSSRLKELAGHFQAIDVAFQAMNVTEEEPPSDRLTQTLDKVLEFNK